MAATTETSISEKFDNFHVGQGKLNGSQLEDLNNLEYGLPLKEVYKLALSFYKGQLNFLFRLGCFIFASLV